MMMMMMMVTMLSDDVDDAGLNDETAPAPVYF